MIDGEAVQKGTPGMKKDRNLDNFGQILADFEELMMYKTLLDTLNQEEAEKLAQTILFFLEGHTNADAVTAMLGATMRLLDTMPKVQQRMYLRVIQAIVNEEIVR